MLYMAIYGLVRVICVDTCRKALAGTCDGWRWGSVVSPPHSSAGRDGRAEIWPPNSNLANPVIYVFFLLKKHWNVVT